MIPDRILEDLRLTPGTKAKLHKRETGWAFADGLIASDWIEQNTGRAALRPDGTLAACYRVTPQGLREFRRIHGVEAAEEHPEASDKSPQRVPRRKRERQEVNESGAVAAAGWLMPDGAARGAGMAPPPTG